jgi:hypothetical protein
MLAAPTLVSSILYYLHSYCNYFSALRRGQRKKNIEKMYTSIAAEQCNEDGVIIKKRQLPQRGQQSARLAKKPKLDTAGMDNESDPDDSNFVSDGSSTESLEDGDTEVDEAQPSNAEVCL